MTEAQTTPELVERWRNQIEHARKHPDSPLTLGSLCHALSDAADHAERQATELDRLRAVVEALLSVVAATRAYLPPDGIDAQECLNRILAATDNPTINAVIRELEDGRA